MKQAFSFSTKYSFETGFKPENREQSIWDLISEIEIVPDNSL